MEYFCSNLHLDFRLPTCVSVMKSSLCGELAGSAHRPSSKAWFSRWLRLLLRKPVASKGTVEERMSANSSWRSPAPSATKPVHMHKTWP